MKDLWVAVSGAVAAQRNVETIANNVANVNTPGFKRDELSFREHLTALEKGTSDVDLPSKEWGPEDFYRSYGAEDAYVKVDGNFTIHEQGQLTATNNPLDIALNGPGFFEIMTPNGLRYTRRGNFSIDKEGTLVTNQGFPVLAKTPGARPEDRKIKLPTTAQTSITLQGEIFSSGNKLAELSVVEFKDKHALKKEGNAFFINADEKNILEAPLKTGVHQGFVEESNVNALSEMSNLIKANRHFETIQRAIKAYDNTTGRSVNDIAKF